MALLTLLVEVERVKMVVVCRSAGTVVHLEYLIISVVLTVFLLSGGDGWRVKCLCWAQSTHQFFGRPRLVVIHNNERCRLMLTSVVELLQ